MKKITMLLFLTFLINSNIFGQETRLKPFVLEGTIALDSGTVMLRMIADSSFYNKSVRNLKSKIKAGKFRIEGEIPHPMAFTIDVEGKYYSDIVLINPTEQSVNCNIDAKKEKLFVDDQSRAEYETYTATFKAYRIKDSISYSKRKALEDLYKSGLPDSIKAGLDAETDSLYEESDRTLLSFVKNNPASYLGLWITNRLSNWGYEKILDDIYTGFADPIKYSFAGKILHAKLTQAGKLALGKPFLQ